MPFLTDLARSLAERPRIVRLFGAPEGHDAATIGTLLTETGAPAWLHVCRDDARMTRFAAALGFFHPSLNVLSFPAWDCLPYDRVSPNADLVSRRIDVLTRLAAERERQPFVLLTTVNAVMQRVPPRRLFDGRVLKLGAGGRIPLDRLQGFFRNNGYIRTDTVREPGEYAVRGGIVDLWPSGAVTPIRLDFFGDTLESLRGFDPLTQRSTGTLDGFMLRPVSEVLLDDAAIQRFRSRYREAFGAVGTDDPLYELVSAGRRQAGMEHWLPFYYETLETLFDYVPGAAVSLDYQAEEARRHRLDSIADFYAARETIGAARNATGRSTAPLYRPVKPDRMFLGEADWTKALSAAPRCSCRRLRCPRKTSRIPPPQPSPASGGGSYGSARRIRSPQRGSADAFDAGARPAKNFAAERADTRINLFDAVRDYLAAEQKAGRRAAIAAYSEGSADRLATVLREHGVAELRRVADAAALAQLPRAARRRPRPAAARTGLCHARPAVSRRAGHPRRPPRPRAAPPPQRR